jgi:hypothetical protein
LTAAKRRSPQAPKAASCGGKRPALSLERRRAVPAAPAVRLGWLTSEARFALELAVLHMIDLP